MADKERTLQDFRRLADAWGGSIERWPEKDRAWARALARDPEAAEILAEARRLDSRIASRPEVSEARAAVVAGAVMGRIAHANLARRRGLSPLIENVFAPRSLRVAAAGACIAAATVAGALLGAGPQPDSALQNVAALQFLVGEDALLFGAALL